MQQHTRGTPGSISPATSPRTIPSRSTNQRDRPRDQNPDRDSSEPFPYSEKPSSEGVASNTGAPAERAAKNAEKARQVTQNFFKRAALTIVSSRVNLPPEFIPDTTQVRSTKWFQMVLDESEELSEELADWTMLDIVSERPQPLIIEIYLDTSELTRNQTLVVLDERGGKWDVCDALTAPGTSSQDRNRQARRTRVVLERWKIYLGDPPPSQSSTSTEPMPNVYKKAIILFRSLYTYCRFLPTWKFGRKIAKQPATLNALRPMYRILDEEPRRSSKDPLATPLYPSAEPTIQTYDFLPLKSPVGSYNIHVSYRVNCDFRVDDSEALLSSHFMGIDDQYSPRPASSVSGHAVRYPPGSNDAGSLPVDRRWLSNRSDVTQAYGSLSTFHHQGHGPGTSPISALRAARELVTDSQGESPPQRAPPSHRTSQSSKASLRSEGTAPVQRRVSVSFQPFKHGSLSSSPATGIIVPQSPNSSAAVRGSDSSQGVAQTRNRTSLTALPQTALRAPPTPAPEVAVGSPSSGSPKAPGVGRYSSSFGHRRSRFSSGGGGSSKTEDDNNSSGKGSQTSSIQPGSGLLAEAEGGSSGSAQTDDDNISDFLKLLEQKKDLKSFNRTDDASRDASTRRTSAALSKFRSMRESNAALGESLSSSLMMQRSSSASSRQLSSVPPMLAGASVSTSSSPSKPISPHTPHTPAIPSRLSEHSTIRREESRTRGQTSSSQPESASSGNDDSSDSTTRNHGSGAIPIPTSPMRHPYIRRSSSAHQRHRAGLQALEDYDYRPASLPGLDDRPELSLSELLHTQQTGEQRTATEGESANRDTAAPIPGSSIESHDEDRAPSSAVAAGAGTARPGLRTRGSRRGSGSTSSISRASGFSERASRYSFSTRPAALTADDEEPLLFTMSELGRRSFEDMQSSTAPSTPAGRGGAEPGGGSSRGVRRGGSGPGSVW